MINESDELKSLMVHSFEIPLKVHENNLDDLYPILLGHIEWMIENRMEALLSTLYRLDVLESKINAVLTPDFPLSPAQGITNLVIERQKERYQTKLKYHNTEYTKDWIELK